MMPPPSKPMKKIYIAGKIAGDKNYREKFLQAKADLIIKGVKAGERYQVMNPAVLPAGMESGDYMRICFSMLDSADAIYMLKDWKDSQGAILEYKYAEYVGKKIMFEKDPTPI